MAARIQSQVLVTQELHLFCKVHTGKKSSLQTPACLNVALWDVSQNKFNIPPISAAIQKLVGDPANTKMMSVRV